MFQDPAQNNLEALTRLLQQAPRPGLNSRDRELAQLLYMAPQEMENSNRMEANPYNMLQLDEAIANAKDARTRAILMEEKTKLTRLQANNQPHQPDADVQRMMKAEGPEFTAGQVQMPSRNEVPFSQDPNAIIGAIAGGLGAGGALRQGARQLPKMIDPVERMFAGGAGRMGEAVNMAKGPGKSQMGGMDPRMIPPAMVGAGGGLHALMKFIAEQSSKGIKFPPHIQNIIDTQMNSKGRMY